LDRQQVRRAEDARALTKVLTDALLFGERIGHVRITLFQYQQALRAKINEV
jgi:hypothetical protein